MPSTPLVTRFAPSPTGHLHLGNARTALLNFLAARSSGGRFILRVEDTDEPCGADGAIHDLLADLKWLGIDWDEGPDIGGPHADYRQQQRREIYESWLAKLDALGLTYPCFCTPAQLNASRRRQLAAGMTPRYAGTCRTLSDAQQCERLIRGEVAALRFKAPIERVVTFDDLICGEQRFASESLGDFILRRADGGTAAFFSNAIDDALMGVTFVLRGDDHLVNTPKQLLVLQALELSVPKYAHIALLSRLDGVPLSNRHSGLSVRDLRRRGFFPGAIRNHLARLGHVCVHDRWLDDAALVASFDVSRLGRAAARFDDRELRRWQEVAVEHLASEKFIAWTSQQLSAPMLSAGRASHRRAEG